MISIQPRVTITVNKVVVRSSVHTNGWVGGKFPTSVRNFHIP